jgi:hypothetical protein
MKKTIIIDFGASLIHTHHSRVILGFIQLLQKKSQFIVLYLPKGSELDFTNSKIKLFKNLLPSYHPVEFKLKNLSTWVPTTLRIVYTNTQNKFMYRFTSKILSKVIVNVTFRSLKKSHINLEDYLIIFPTACPISLLLGLKLEKMKIEVRLIYRMTNTAEHRTYFSNLVNIQDVIKKLSNSIHINVQFGYEMLEYARRIPVQKSQLSYSPTPPCLEIFLPKQKDSEITFGFLGMAQSHKGINWLVKIVTDTFKNSIYQKLSWIIQTLPNPSQEIISLSEIYNVKLLFGRLNEVDISYAFSKLDCVCLPYEISSYAENASALAYRAADNMVVVATLKGSAFAREIRQYDIGIVAENLEDLISKLNQFEKEDYAENIRSYNLMREKTNLEMLRLDN